MQAAVCFQSMARQQLLRTWMIPVLSCPMAQVVSISPTRARFNIAYTTLLPMAH
jgi:hypothetical protein